MCVVINCDIIKTLKIEPRKFWSLSKLRFWCPRFSTTLDFVRENTTGEVKTFIQWQAQFYKNLSDRQAKDLNFFWKTSHHELYNATNKTLKIESWETGETFDYSL